MWDVIFLGKVDWSWNRNNKGLNPQTNNNDSNEIVEANQDNDEQERDAGDPNITLNPSNLTELMLARTMLQEKLKKKSLGVKEDINRIMTREK